MVKATVEPTLSNTRRIAAEEPNSMLDMPARSYAFSPRAAQAGRPRYPSEVTIEEEETSNGVGPGRSLAR